MIATGPLHLMELFAERAAAGDVEALLALYEPDAVFEPRSGTVLSGTAQIREALTGFVAMRPVIEYSGQPGCVGGGDVALVSNTWTMSCSPTPRTAATTGAGAAPPRDPRPGVPARPAHDRPAAGRPGRHPGDPHPGHHPAVHVPRRGRVHHLGPPRGGQLPDGPIIGLLTTSGLDRL
jgi:hypothetical protein